jgi:protein gp37
MGVCPVTNCWSEAMSKRQGWDFHRPELLTKNLLDPLKKKKPTRILVNFSGDLFGDWVDPNTPIHIDGLLGYDKLRDGVDAVVANNWRHTFIFLTKAPENIWKIDWPDNCWMGASVWDTRSFVAATYTLQKIRAKHKWLSLEPFLKAIPIHSSITWLRDGGISFVVIGAEDHPLKLPRKEWVTEIESACIEANIPYWEKNNLKTLFDRPLHQEYPNWRD